MSTSTDQLLANVEALTAALKRLSPGEAVLKRESYAAAPRIRRFLVLSCKIVE